jgi:hypothetical protein
MKRGRFPQRIKRGSCVVTIYRTPNKGYVSFTVAHYDAKELSINKCHIWGKIE